MWTADHLIEINNYCEEKNEPQIYNWANALTIKDYDYVRDFKLNIENAIKKIDYYSPSLINPYLKCPRMFFFDKILGLNSPNFSIPDSMNFGLAVHKACENAIKYNKTDGKVDVWVGNTLQGIKIIVSDTGIGIPAELQERIFERFFRVDKSHSKETGGTGLGLSIVKHAAIYHHAQINVESELGQGTKIEIVFNKLVQENVS